MNAKSATIVANKKVRMSISRNFLPRGKTTIGPGPKPSCGPQGQLFLDYFYGQ
jgi:hypothetical protein